MSLYMILAENTAIEYFILTGPFATKIQKTFGE